MKTSNFKLLTIFTAMVLFIGTFSSCSDDGLTANVTVNEGPNGDIGGDLQETVGIRPEPLIGLII